MPRMVSGILDHKGTGVWAVVPSDTMLRALEAMADHNIGAVLVLDGEELVGIVTERDYARKVKLFARGSGETPVTEVMTTEILTVRPSTTVAECMELMTNRRVRHLPVIGDDGGLAGLVSIGDVVKAMIAEQRDLIEQLERYITT
ncbi:MAG: CBS domain-containing protein [Actinomycetota bacterium]